jgi:hypothetical protein
VLEPTTVEKVFDLDRPLFSRDFIVVDLLPSVMLAGSIAGILMAGAPGEAPNGRDFTAALSETTGISIVLLFAASLALAIATHPLRQQNRRLLTGAWTGRVGSRLARILKSRAEDRFKRANEAVKVSSPTQSSPELQRKAQDLKRRFPHPESLTPTRLGNAYEALWKLVPESEQVLEADGFIVLLGTAEPKAYQVAYAQASANKDPIVPLIDDVQLQIAAAERYTAVWIATAVAYVWLLAEHGWWLLLPAAALLMGHVAYRGAVESVVEFSYLIDQLFERVKGDETRGLPSAKEPGAA